MILCAVLLYICAWLEAVEPIPGVIGGLEGAVRDSEGLLQGRGSVMSLSLASIIQRLEIYCSPRVSIVFSLKNHTMAPCHWSIWLNPLQHSESHISLKVGPDLLVPVGGHGGGSVADVGLGGRVHVELKGRPVHHGQRLVSACVKC